MLDHMDITGSGRVRKVTTEKTWPPQEWPKRLKDLCEAYSDMLMDELRPQERLKVPDTLKPGTKPFFCTRARPVLIHWKENTDKEKQKLLREGTIERCNGNQIRWCSPAHWAQISPGDRSL